jgi:hypothetical protein
MRTAILDTTILTDLLLKHATRGKVIRDCLSEFDEILIPGYAVKELVAGPLTYFTWLHNRVATAQSLQEVFDWIHRVSRTPRRYATSTVIEALREAASRAEEIHAAGVAGTYGNSASLDLVVRDQLRLSLRGMIRGAWARLRGYAQSVVDAPSCYRIGDLTEEGDLLTIDGTRCSDNDCRLWPIVEPKASVAGLRAAVTGTPTSRERERRLAVLTRLETDPRAPVNEQECRALGDVMIALSGPAEAVVVTSNERDFAPLCRALDKELVNPYAGRTIRSSTR